MRLSKIEKKLPVFLCTEIGAPNRKQWTFWCPFCHHDHFHSAERGSRVAHCGPDSALFGKEYMLVLNDPNRKRTA